MFAPPISMLFDHLRYGSVTCTVISVYFLIAMSSVVLTGCILTIAAFTTLLFWRCRYDLQLYPKCARFEISTFNRLDLFIDDHKFSPDTKAEVITDYFRFLQKYARHCHFSCYLIRETSVSFVLTWSAVYQTVLVPATEHGYFVASWWRTPLCHPPSLLDFIFNKLRLFMR
jgi:hypothetical protein